MIEIFLNNVIWLRKHYGLSKKEMAKKLEIGIGTLNKIEKGELPPELRIDVLYCIWKEFGISMADVIIIPLDSDEGKELLAMMKK